MDIDILEQHSISLPSLKKKLEALKERNKELNFRATKVWEYLEEFATLDYAKAEDYRQKILALNIPRLKDKHIDKILDLHPESVEEIKSLLTGENVTIKQEDIEKILSVLKG